MGTNRARKGAADLEAPESVAFVKQPAIGMTLTCNCPLVGTKIKAESRQTVQQVDCDQERAVQKRWGPLCRAEQAIRTAFAV